MWWYLNPIIDDFPQGDIWAESWGLGLLWHYYACMETSVYDITEWAACQAVNLKHLKANSHSVTIRSLFFFFFQVFSNINNDDINNLQLIGINETIVS